MRTDPPENWSVVVELFEEQRMLLAEYARLECREHREVHTVFQEARQELNAVRRSCGFFPDGNGLQGQQIRESTASSAGRRRHLSPLRGVEAFCSKP